MADDSLAVEEQAALFDELAHLIERCGISPFVAAPLLEADDRFFPDEWHPDDASVGRLARRLLDYAGLGSYSVAVELAANTDEAPAAAVWFAGLEGMTCRVGGWTVAAWFIAWPVIGFAFGKRRRRDRCSDSSCKGVLPLSASVCPGCGGTIAATLKNRNDRLDAEERLRLNRADYDADVGTESVELARGARPLFTPSGVAGGLIGADVHKGDDEETERGTSSTVV